LTLLVVLQVGLIAAASRAPARGKRNRLAMTHPATVSPLTQSRHQGGDAAYHHAPGGYQAEAVEKTLNWRAERGVVLG
jgi:hypothetical protein